jgi:hypothetical protein
LPLRFIEGIIDGLSPSVYFREFEKNHTSMPLEHTNGITDRLSLSVYSREVWKNHSDILLFIIDGITDWSVKDINIYLVIDNFIGKKAQN